MLVIRRLVLALIVMGCLWGPATHAQTALPLHKVVSDSLATVEIGGTSASCQQPMIQMIIDPGLGGAPPLVVPQGLVWMQVKGYSLHRIEETLGVSLIEYQTATLGLIGSGPGGKRVTGSPASNPAMPRQDNTTGRAEVQASILIVGGAVILLVAVALGALFWRRRTRSLPETPAQAARQQQATAPFASVDKRCSGCGNPISQCSCAGAAQMGRSEPGSAPLMIVGPGTGEHEPVASGPRLIALDGNCAGQEYALPHHGDCLLSRAELPIVTIFQPTISAPHALIRLDKHPHRIKDLNSANGTVVGGRRLSVSGELPDQKLAILKDGVQIVFGDVAFTFEEAPPLLRDGQGKPYPLQPGSRTIVSRSPLPTRVLRDRTISAPQALIRKDDERYTILDLNSGNGTEVGMPVAGGFDYLSGKARQPLRDGVRLRLGRVLLEMRDQPQPAPAGLPRRIDSYQIVGMVGVGGMAYVLDGRGPRGERVAVKIPKEVLAYDESFRERFKRETNSMARLEHPNIVRVLAVGQVKEGRHLVGDMGLQYIVMSYVDGCSLSRLLAKGEPLPDRVAAGVVRHVAQALQHAHRKGVIHRDIKPSNILISHEGQVLLTDFGIARAQGEATITQPGELPCSPQYVSPEHFTNKKVDEQSDVYSLGVVFYQMLTGKVPFDGNAPLQTVLFRHQSEEPVPPKEIRGDVPAELAAIALKCLAKEPTERFDSAEALLAALPPSEPAAAALARMVAEALGKRHKPRKPTAITTEPEGDKE